MIAVLECTLNCTPLRVSEEMCDLARKVLKFLESDEATLLLKKN